MSESIVAAPLWISESFRLLEASLNGGRASRLHELRKEALRVLLASGFPAPKNEQWKYTNLSALLRLHFKATPPNAAAQLDERGVDLTFEDGVLGRFSMPVQDGVRILRLSEALIDGAIGDWVEAALRGHIEQPERPFCLLNTALAADGVVIHVAAGTKVQRPITVCSTADARPGTLALFPRVLIAVGQGAECTIIERHTGRGSDLTVPVTTISLGDGAHVEHVRFQNDDSASYHVSSVDALVARNAALRTQSLSFGGKLVRNEVQVRLDGDGANAELNGLTAITGTQHVDNHTIIEHAKPHGESKEMYKGVYGEHATGVFDGTIVVLPNAQKTNAIQKNQSLLLSPHASCNAKPQLKIWADDVRCTHGATVGQLDSDALFYLQSRGIARPEARRMLTEAFAGDLLAALPAELNLLSAETFKERVEQAFAAGG